eukprot:3168151-Pleurochrysis_carterae.AAC.2
MARAPAFIQKRGVGDGRNVVASHFKSRVKIWVRAAVENKTGYKLTPRKQTIALIPARESTTRTYTEGQHYQAGREYPVSTCNLQN